MLFGKVILEWKKPKLIKSQSQKDLFFNALKQFWRGYLISMLLVAFLYLYLTSISNKELQQMWNEIFLRFSLWIPLLIIAFSIQGLILVKFGATKYIIYQNGFRILGASSRFLRWSGIKGFWVEDSKEYAGKSCLVIATKRHPHRVFLPDDIGLYRLILNTITEYIPQISPGDEIPPVFTKKQICCWVLFSCVFSFLVAYICSLYFVKQLMFIIFFLFLFGPGSVGLLVLVKGEWHEFKQKFSYAYIFNFVSFTFFMLFFVLIQFHYYIKQISDNGLMGDLIGIPK